MNKFPSYIALDFDDKKKALELVRDIYPYVEGFKVGPRLFLKEGPSIVSKLKPYGKVFLDFKFFDIPSTLLASVKMAFNLGVDLVTVHAQVGEESLQQLADLEMTLNSQRKFQILAVTVLTSFSQNQLPPLAKIQSVFSHVESLSDLVIKSGLSGLVCSGQEVAHLRKRHPEAYLMVPGIRLFSQIQDQKRVFTPQEAIQSGASALVMGRAIYNTLSPVAVCIKIQKDWAKKK